jgi:hypothetical protein
MKPLKGTMESERAGPMEGTMERTTEEAMAGHMETSICISIPPNNKVKTKMTILIGIGSLELRNPCLGYCVEFSEDLEDVDWSWDGHMPWA